MFCSPLCLISAEPASFQRNNQLHIDIIKHNGAGYIRRNYKLNSLHEFILKFWRLFSPFYSKFPDEKQKITTLFDLSDNQYLYNSRWQCLFFVNRSKLKIFNIDNCLHLHSHHIPFSLQSTCANLRTAYASHPPTLVHAGENREINDILDLITVNYKLFVRYFYMFFFRHRSKWNGYAIFWNLCANIESNFQ